MTILTVRMESKTTYPENETERRGHSCLVVTNKGSRGSAPETDIWMTDRRLQLTTSRLPIRKGTSEGLQEGGNGGLLKSSILQTSLISAGRPHKNWDCCSVSSFKLVRTNALRPTERSVLSYKKAILAPETPLSQCWR
jgi:hypothetical protein